MNINLKKALNDCYIYGDIITQQGFGPKTDISMKEMLQFDLLQFLAYLSDTEHGSMYSEITFIHEYLGKYFSLDKLLEFKRKRTDDAAFIQTVPRSMTYFAEADKSRKSAYTTSGFSKSRSLFNLYQSLGQEFIACNNIIDDGEIDRLTTYTTMLENYLRKHELYDPVKKIASFEASSKAPDKLQASINAMKGELNPNEVSEADVKLEDLMNELNSLTGLDAVKKDIKSLINILKVNKMREERGLKQSTMSLHMVFSGNPGTGKTTVARLLANIYKCLGVVSKGQLIEADRSTLVEGYVGQTATKTKNVVESALGGILFIDEAYTLTAGKDGKDFGQEAIDTLLKLMEDNRDDLIVIVAGYTELMEEFVESNPGLRSRFNKYILFKDYTGEQLYEIFMSMCKKQDYIPDEDGEKYVKEYLSSLADAHDENFANAREVRNYIERSIARQASRIVELDNISDLQLKTLTRSDLTDSDLL